jgi:hypothetical protein
MSTTRRTVGRGEAQLAYFAATRAIGVVVDVQELSALAEVTFDIEDLKYAVDRISDHVAHFLKHNAQHPDIVAQRLRYGVIAAKEVIPFHGIIEVLRCRRGTSGHA